MMNNIHSLATQIPNLQWMTKLWKRSRSIWETHRIFTSRFLFGCSDLPLTTRTYVLDNPALCFSLDLEPDIFVKLFFFIFFPIPRTEQMCSCILIGKTERRVGYRGRAAGLTVPPWTIRGRLTDGSAGTERFCRRKRFIRSGSTCTSPDSESDRLGFGKK